MPISASHTAMRCHRRIPCLNCFGFSVSPHGSNVAFVTSDSFPINWKRVMVSFYFCFSTTSTFHRLFIHLHSHPIHPIQRIHRNQDRNYNLCLKHGHSNSTASHRIHLYTVSYSLQSNSAPQFGQYCHGAYT